MKVRELIEKLGQFDPEMNVHYSYDSFYDTIPVRDMLEYKDDYPEQIVVVLTSDHTDADLDRKGKVVCG